MKKNIFFCMVFLICLLYAEAGCSRSKTSPSESENTRLDTIEPVVAGQFYPSDRARLKEQIDGYLNKTKISPIEGDIIGLIAPHAGYQYSGPIAAAAFKQIEGRHYDIVVVIAPSHRIPFDGIALTTKDFYETPLGKIPIASDLSKKLITENAWAKDEIRPYLVEHSLEVELPFLQSVIKNFKILPLITGLDQTFDVEKVASALNQILPGKNVLFVASTDLSHYHPYEVAVKKDKKTISLIEDMDVAQFENAAKDNTAELCGQKPVSILMALAKLKGGSARLIHYANSGDTAGDKSRVVGYAALAFVVTQKDKPQKDKLTESQKNTLLKIARQAIEAEVLGKKQPLVNVDDPFLDMPGAAFVTLKKKGELRGCIGHIFAVEKLALSVRDNAIAAATHDPRFDPVRPDELKDISIEISVLTHPEPLSNPLDVRVGIDGLIISKGFNRGVLLPQVPIEQGWNKEQFLEGICRKAGLPPDAWKDARLERFQAIIFSE